MQKTESKQIGRYTYEVTQLGALKGRKVATRLAKLLPALIEAKESGILAGLLDGVDESLVEYVCDAISPNTVVVLSDGKKPRLSDIFDVHFAGEYDELIGWLQFAIEVNFSSFFRVSPSKGTSAAG